jgi:hypothetical protein
MIGSVMGVPHQISKHRALFAVFPSLQMSEEFSETSASSK